MTRYRRAAYHATAQRSDARRPAMLVALSFGLLIAALAVYQA